MVLTNKNKFNKIYKQDKNQANSKEDISRLTRIPMKFLDEIFYRGLKAYENTTKDIKKKVNENAYAFGRVYAFIVKRKEGGLDFDLDISSNIRKYKKKEKEKK
tara:strand:+ start:1114 stop:1422 length:309 start_codon:yes stop_codon:yes gene_type:complete